MQRYFLESLRCEGPLVVRRDVTMCHVTVTWIWAWTACNDQRFHQLSARARLHTMDRLESLGNTLSSLTLYDIKTMYNQVLYIFHNRVPRVISAIGAGGVELMYICGCYVGKKRRPQCQRDGGQGS
jgi:hypothetical protein